MSVLVLDIEVYEAVFEKARKYAFNKTCDINYCHTLSFDNEEQLKEHIKNWMWLNEMSYIRKYKVDDKPTLAEFFDFRKTYNIDTYQMLKYLQCMMYNIEIDTIKTGKTGREDPFLIPQDKMDSYRLLQKAITEISQTIISQIPKYKNAKWGSI